MVSATYPLLGGGVTSAVAAGLPLPSPEQQPDLEPEDQDSGSLSPEFLKRLRDAIKVSYDDLRVHREQYVEREQLYAGHRYGTNDENVDTPFNCYNLALRVYQRRLISGDPKVNVRHHSPDARAEAYELELACEQLFREINLKDTMKEVILQALLCVGVVKVAGSPADRKEGLGFLHDAEQPFCDPVLLENFVYDTNAKRWEQIDFCGDRYRMPLDALQNDPRFNRAAVAQLGRGQTRQDEELRQDDQESVQRLGVEKSPFQDDLRDYVTLWDIWLPREKLLVTLPDGSGDPILIQRWEGPENGPYHLLCFDPIPGNVMPVAPGSHLESLARLLNRAIRKLGDQLDRQKTIGTITPTAANAGDDKTIQDTPDGGLAQVMDPKNIGEIRIGGVDQQSYAMTLGLRDLWSWLSGNIDTLGGLSTQAGTLGQEELLAGGGNSLISELNSKVLDFLKGVCTDLAWYVYSDPNGTRKLVKRLQGTNVELPVEWGPERRTLDFFLFEFDVDPFSVHVRTPSERLQMIVQMMPIVLQAAQLQTVLRQSGQDMDMEGFWRLLTRYSGLEELSEFLRVNGMPITAAPAAQQSQPGGMPQLPSMNVSGVPHEYIRRNVSSGGRMQGPGQQALEQMMAAGTTNANGGGGGM
jgi:hypothetical protein